MAVAAVTKQRALLAAVVVGTSTLSFVGRGAPAIAFIVIVAGTFAAYAALILSLSHHQAIGKRALIAACIGTLVVAVAVPARSSKDVWAYVMYGRIVAQHHASPYTHVPAEYPSDPALQRVQDSFRNTGSVYGPVFTGISAAGMAVCGSSPVCGRMFFQILEALAVLAAAWIVLRATGSWAAAACVGLNPVLIASIVNGAHNDGLVAAGLLGAVVLARERPVVAGALVGLAALIKVNVLLPGAVLVVWLLLRDDKRRALEMAATSGVLVVGGYLAAGGLVALRPLHNTAMFVSRHSVWYVVEQWITKSLASGGWTRARALDYAAHLIPTLGLIVVVVIALIVAGGRLRDHGPAPVVAAALAVYVLVSPYVLPWYTAPLIPLLALRWRSKTTWLVLAYSALLFLAYPARYPVHHTFTGLILPTTARDVLPVVELVILAAIAVAAWRPRRPARPRPVAAMPELS